MSRWNPINQNTTPNLRWTTQPRYFFAAMDTLAPLTHDELNKASKDMVILFIANDQGGFKLVALQSLQPDLNVYVDSAGQWRGTYLPNFYKTLPFASLKSGEDQLVVYYDEESPLMDETAGTLNAQLYDDNGEFSEDFHKQLEFMRRYLVQQDRTQLQVETLQKHGLIQAWDLELDLFHTGEPLKIQGLFRIREEDLLNLSPEALAELNACGALKVAYTHLTSFSRFKDLSRFYLQNDQVRKELQERHAARGRAQVDLDELDGDLDDDELFKF